MLVLTRKTDEEIVVVPGSEPITIRINKVRGDKVSVGLTGEGSAFYRRELIDRTTEREEEKSHER